MGSGCKGGSRSPTPTPSPRVSIQELVGTPRLTPICRLWIELLGSGTTSPKPSACPEPAPQSHSPMSLALTATGLRSSVTNFLASRRISMMLFSSANSGARGKDATNKVTKPNWMTARRVGRSARYCVPRRVPTCHKLNTRVGGVWLAPASDAPLYPHKRDPGDAPTMTPGDPGPGGGCGECSKFCSGPHC